MATNREYLNSLSNEDFARWMLDSLEVVDRSGRYPLSRLDGFHYVILSYIDPYMGFVKWLNQERKETVTRKGDVLNGLEKT